MTAQKFWKIMGFQKMINSHDVQLVNSNENFIPKSSSDGGNLNRFWVGRNVYGFRQKRKINDFQMKIIDDLEWNFEKVYDQI